MHFFRCYCAAFDPATSTVLENPMQGVWKNIYKTVSLNVVRGRHNVALLVKAV